MSCSIHPNLICDAHDFYCDEPKCLGPCNCQRSQRMAEHQQVKVAPIGMPGGVPIHTVARVAAVDLMVEEFGMLDSESAWNLGMTRPEREKYLGMLIDRVATWCERDNVSKALDILSVYVDLTAAYRIIAVLHTEGMKG